MTVHELINELAVLPGEAQVFYDTFDTKFFKAMRKACGNEMKYPDGNIAKVEVIDEDNEDDCTVFLKEARE